MAWRSDAILTALALHGARECVTTARLAEHAMMDVRAVQNACALLLRHDFISRTQRGCHKITASGLAAHQQSAQVRPGKHAPNPLRQRAWAAMRIAQKFSIPDICLMAAEGNERDIEFALGKYLRALERAGYLVRLPVKERGGFIRYRLVRSSGPLAPQWRAIDNTVRDANTDEVFTCG